MENYKYDIRYISKECEEIAVVKLENLDCNDVIKFVERTRLFFIVRGAVRAVVLDENLKLFTRVTFD